MTTLNKSQRHNSIQDKSKLGKKENEPVVIIGDVLMSRYKITKLLFSGSFGNIFCGIMLQTKDEVIMKISGSDKSSINASCSEYNILTKLANKKNEKDNCNDNDIFFPKIIDMFKIPTNSWCSTDYYQVIVQEKYGPDLYERVLKSNLKMSMKTIQTIFRQLAKTIKIAHSMNIIHKDIKCENILLRRSNNDTTDDLNIVLIDYGSSIDIVSEQQSLGIHTGVLTSNDSQLFFHLVGTLAYMSPEEIKK